MPSWSRLRPVRPSFNERDMSWGMNGRATIVRPGLSQYG